MDIQENSAVASATAAGAAARIIAIAQASITLNEGEHYAGIVLGPDGLPSHHLILLGGDAEDLTWAQANTFAAEAGGELPTRCEQSLLFANLKGQFERDWYWSGEQRAAFDACAWGQHFITGYQYVSLKSAQLRARAVRRLAI
jgi:hypothetical protein